MAQTCDVKPLTTLVLLFRQVVAANLPRTTGSGSSPGAILESFKSAATTFATAACHGAFSKAFETLVAALFHDVATEERDVDTPVDLAALTSSHVVQALTFFLGLRQDDGAGLGLLGAAVRGHYAAVGGTDTGDADFIRLLRWFGEEVCEKQWGLADSWVSFYRSPALDLPASRSLCALQAAAAYSTPSLVSWLVTEKGLSPNGDFKSPIRYCPLYVALEFGNVATFERLLDLGADVFSPYEPSYPSWQKLPAAIGLVLDRARDKVCGDPQYSVFAKLLAKRPEVLGITRYQNCDTDDNGNRFCVNWLGTAIVAQDVKLVKLALEANGGKLSFKREPHVLGVVLPPLEWAFRFPDYDVLELLIREYKALEGYQDKYEPCVISQICNHLSDIAASAFAIGPNANMDFIEIVQHDPDGLRIAELALSSGFCSSWDGDGCNSLVLSLRCYAVRDMREEDVITILGLYQDAGINITHSRKEDADKGCWDNSLAHFAARIGWPKVLRYAIEDAGCPVDYPQPKDAKELTPLTTALMSRHFDAASALVSKHKAKAAYPDLPAELQPVWLALCSPEDNDAWADELNGPELTDAQLETFLSALVDRDPSLLDVSCFRDERATWNPIAHCVQLKKPSLLEILLSRNLAEASVLAASAAPFAIADHATVRATAAQIAASLKHWQCLEVLLRLCRGLRVTQPTHFTSSDGRAGSTPSVDGIIDSLCGSNAPPPRSVVALVTARAQFERQVMASLAFAARSELAHQCQNPVDSETPFAGRARQLEAVITPRVHSSGPRSSHPLQSAVPAASSPLHAAAGTASNSFEDPSLRRLSGDEENKLRKPKKKRAKSKGERRAAAGAAEGGSRAAGCAAVDSSSDDDDAAQESFEEPDDNLVDSRFAPSLDLMLERMGLKDGARTSANDCGGASAAKKDSNSIKKKKKM